MKLLQLLNPWAPLPAVPELEAEKLADLHRSLYLEDKRADHHSANAQALRQRIAKLERKTEAGQVHHIGGMQRVAALQAAHGKHFVPTVDGIDPRFEAAHYGHDLFPKPEKPTAAKLSEEIARFNFDDVRPAP